MDEATNLIGLPLNPTGRSGLRDKGLLPHWGPNHAITIALTRPHPDGLMQAGLPVLQVAALFRNQNFCLPWVYAGFLHDHLNADHAWLETIFLNIHQSNEEPLRPELLEISHEIQRVGIEKHSSHRIRIEKQCVKAVLTRSNADELEPDVVLQASQSGPPSRGPRAAPPTGRILERVLLSHRLWRIVPFNFEIYPGIRMNVPIEMLNWKVPYKEYRAFKITEDRLAIPYAGMDDGPEV
ncbi:hypothetical protein AHF37_01908 [Paragonimus kellicotti]|nr:hypothetical protein AHF37_01908 [Paragonimus kellicotti]